jgi:hypothetical protein
MDVSIELDVISGLKRLLAAEIDNPPLFYRHGMDFR